MLSFPLTLLVAVLPPAAAVDLESTTMALANDAELALVDGRVWRRAPGGAWSLLPPDGLPAPRGRIERLKELLPMMRTFDAPSRIAELSADGENIVVTAVDGRVYYAKLGSLDWDDVWGPPTIAAPLRLPSTKKAWAISHRKQAYSDVDGNVHPVSAGVTTLYVLTDDDRIVYADPWLPPDFSREVCPPERGRLVLVALAASSSTIAVMDDAGRVFTRLADFDTLGNNPLLPYTWERGKRGGILENVRTLPPEDWKLQPPVPSPHSASLTILQTGDGNGSRLLRVEGDEGFWEKDLDAARWRFVKRAGRKASTPFIAAKKPSARAQRGVDLYGRTGGVHVDVEDFFVECPGSRMAIRNEKEELVASLWFSDRPLDAIPRSRSLSGAVLVDGAPKGPLTAELLREFTGPVVGPHSLAIKLVSSAKHVILTSDVPAFSGVRLVLRPVATPESVP